jgi:DNA-directed RNA polymerase specialized sigma24 family protein
MTQPTFPHTSVFPLENSPVPQTPGRPDNSSEDFREQYGRAFEDGFRRTVAVLRQKGARPEQAEEYAQAAWSRGWEYRVQLKDPSRVVEWVTSIALNLFWSEAPKGRRFVSLSTAGFEPSVLPSANIAAIDLERALADCPARQKNLVDAIYLHGQSVEDLMFSMRVSAGAIHHRLSRARRTLRRMLTAA